MAVCPHCGNAVQLTKSAAQWGGDWQPSTVSQLQTAVSPPWAQNASPAAPMVSEASRRAPARPATMESDVFVPLAQSFATGVALLVPGIGLTIWLELPWYTPLAISGGGITLTWLYLLDAHRKLLWLVETISNRDLDGDGEAGHPEPEPDEVVLHVRHETPAGSAPHQQLFTLPDGVSRELLVDFANRYQVVGLSQSAWSGKGNPFSKTQFNRFMTTLREAGIIEWSDQNNHSQGQRITRGGRAALEYLADGNEHLHPSHPHQA